MKYEIDWYQIKKKNFFLISYKVHPIHPNFLWDNTIQVLGHQIWFNAYYANSHIGVIW